MRMWMWFGYDLGPFLFAGLDIQSRWAFALTWIALFFVALLFEASKVYLAKVQREAQKKLFPYRSDERRDLLCQEHGALSEPGTSRNASSGQVGRWGSFRARVLINLYQSFVFVVHNTVGYLLMLAVMVYNAHLLLAVVLGMMLGYFLFGAKLTRLQMQCFRTKRVVICTPECDDTAESSPPLLDASLPAADFFVCQTRGCIQPSHYFPAGAAQRPACHYGAPACPARVARLKRLDCKAREESAHEQLLGESRCKQPPGPPAEAARQACCAGSSSQATVREDSPPACCSHASKSTHTDSQEQII